SRVPGLCFFGVQASYLGASGRGLGAGTGPQGVAVALAPQGHKLPCSPSITHMASGARGRLLHPTIYLVASASRGTQDGRGQGRNRRPHAERSPKGEHRTGEDFRAQPGP
ncbi:hypothetical protein D0X64_25155, partial [Salmonella enterica]|nr:hypothetical protein [Salmonella enterica]